MNKLKMFALASGLLLVTAGVFAGKSKFFATTYYAVNGSTAISLPSFEAGSDFSTAGSGTPVQGTFESTTTYYIGVGTTSNPTPVPLYLVF